MIKRKLRKVLSGILTGVLLSGHMGEFYAFAADGSEAVESISVEDEASANTISRSENDNDEKIIPEDKTYSFDYEAYSVEYTVTSHWDGCCNVTVKIKNTSDSVIHNWNLSFCTDDEIQNIYNAKILSSDESKYVLKNLGYNQDIVAGSSVQFGFQVNFGESFDLPGAFYMCTTEAEVDPSDYSVEMSVFSEWDNGSTGEIRIKNNSDADIEDWVLTVQTKGSFTNVWGAEKEKTGDEQYELSCPSYAQDIPAGQTAVIGYQMEGEEREITVLGLREKKYDPERSSSENSVSDDEAVKIIKLPPFDEWDSLPDADGDELPDEVEDSIGTDKNDPDSDDDGLPDGYELIKHGTDPLNIDTDGNGIDDPDEDYDKDGLNELDEYKFGTDFHLEDTDGDDLTDGEEIHIYGTDPVKVDTDGDGVLDGDEIALGLDPADMTDGDTQIRQEVSEDDITVNEYNDVFKLSVELTASNNVKKYIQQGVSDHMGVLADGMFTGVPVHIDYTAGKVSSGKISFRVVEENAVLEDYAVFYLDEEADSFFPVDCEYNEADNTISVSSEYMGDLFLADRNSYLEHFGIEEKADVRTVEARSAVFSASDEEETEWITETYEDRSEAADLSYDFGTFRFFNGHAYAVKRVNMNWLDAEAYCESVGGHLATITSAEEEEFIYKEFFENAKLPNIFFLGTIVKKGQDYKWITGEEYHYASWMERRTDDNRFYEWANSYAALRGRYGILFSSKELVDHFDPLKWEQFYVCEWDNYDFLTDTDNDNRIESLGGNFLPKDFGTINSISDRDYDHDTIPDVDEIDFDAIRKISGDAIGRITVKEYNSFYGYASCPKRWRLSMSDTALRQLEDIEIVPVVSNPFSQDTDNDYYPDEKDKNIAIADPMYINDAAIDDSYLFSDSVNPKSDDESNWSDGTLKQSEIDSISSDKADKTVPTLSFHRKCSAAKFTITPEELSYYSYNIDWLDDSAPWYVVRITYDKNGQEMTPDIWEGGSVLLEPGKTYTIEILSVGNAEIEYDFSIHQDNWVYAPDGGVWKYEKTLYDIGDGYLYNSDPALESVLPSKKLYFTFEQLYTAVTKRDFDNADPMETKIDDVMDKIQVKWESTVDPNINIAVTIGGAYIGMRWTPIGWVVFAIGAKWAIDSKLRDSEIESVRRILESDNRDISCSICSAGDGKEIRNINAEKAPFYINRIDSGFQIGEVERIYAQEIISEMGLD